jgi:hypothetical protein
MAKKYTADTFEGAVTGTASGNVAKTGDTMTGQLYINTSGSSQLRCNNNRAVFGTHYTNTDVWIYANNNGDSIYLGGGIGSIQNDVKVQNGYIYTSQGLRVGGIGTSNELDDYEEGIFNLEWAYGVFGGISYYDLSDFGGNKSETSTYVKVGRHVTVTSVFRYGSLPTAWSQSSGVVYLKLPFTVNLGYYANGTYSAFPGSGAAGSPSLFPTNYSSGFSLLGLHKSGLGSFGTFQTLTVGDMPGIGPSGYAEFKISFSFYTTS